ncbi:MAG: hypothetical protein V8T45_12180 [Oscillospiraceae bacterium]
MAITISKNIKLVLVLLCLVFLCVFGFSAYKIISTLNGYKVAEENYNAMSQQYVTTTETTPKPSPADGEEPEEEEVEVSPSAWTLPLSRLRTPRLWVGFTAPTPL